MNNYIMQNIRYLRKKNGWSQKQLAEITQCSLSTIINWECGINYPTYIPLLRLEEVFKVSLDDLAHRNMEAE